MVIIDVAKRAVMDAFYGFFPAMSPDQRWIVYRKFYPRWHEASISEEYLVYDLTKTGTQNRPSGISLTDPENVGRAVFPVGRTNLLWDNSDLPEDRTHRAAARSFYWSADSQVLVFGDTLQGRFQIIAVTINKDGSTSAYEHPVSVFEVCVSKPAPNDFNLVISEAAIAQQVPGEYVIKADFQSVPGICIPKSMELRFPDDFKASAAEAPFEHHYKRLPAVVDQ